MTESSTRGLHIGKNKTSKTDPAEFRKNHAVIIGIDKYSNGISPLATAGNDARRLAQILEEQYDYSITLLVKEVTRSRLQDLFQEELPEQVDPNDRLLIYFAGHGVALDGDNGPEGYLIPQNATLDEDSFWPMTELHKALDDLPCRHMLAILDCCFAGAFRWSSTRDLQPLPSVIYRERYERFLRDPAWQVITSAAYNQKALDTLSGYVVGTHGVTQEEENPHSPFALSLFEALHGAADCTPKDGDGIITATELYLYLRDQVEVNAEQLIDHRQTPGLWPLNKHRQGEFIFLLPDYELDLPPAPDLTEENNPYKGLSAYEKNDSELFFGRTDLIKELQQQVEEQPFTVVLGASGTGKSSLVKAGLLPALNKEETNESAQEDNFSQPSSWFILEKEVERNGEKKKRIMRPGTNPAAALRSLLINDLPGVRPERKEGATPAGMIGQWRKKHPGKKLLLIIDQFEEIITLCQEEEVREDFIDELMQALEKHSEVLRVVLTLRSDFEAQISQNYLKDWWQEDNRFVVPPMTQNELREVIEQPASVMVLYFEPRELVDRLINEVIQTPGALPLLSFTLSELYRRYIERQKDVEQQDGNRALTEADYEAIGGVIGSLRRRIDNEYEQLPDAAHKETMKRLMLRMVAFEGGELTRRRVPIWEFEYPDAAENERVKIILDRLLQVRLIVGGKNEDSKGGTESYVEPAHDALVVAWDKLLKWRAEEAESMLLQRQLTRAAADWEGSSGEKEVKGLLWDNNPRLLRTQEILREKRSGTTKVAKRSGLFRRLKQFWRVLFPSYKDLDQYIWLNQVETGFVRRSIERKRNWTRGVTVFISVVIVALASAGVVTWIQRENAISSLYEANYNLAKAFEEKALAALDIADGRGDTVTYQKAFLFTSAALKQETKRFPLPPISIETLFDPEVFITAFGTLWISSSVSNHEDVVNSVAFSPDGKTLASASGDKNIRLWDIKNGNEVTIFTGHEEGVNWVAYSPDGKKLASASDDKTIRLWDIKSGKEVATFRGHEDEVYGVTFSPDGKKLGSASKDNTVRLWDIERSKNTLVFTGHEAEVISVAFNPDGTRIASASLDFTVRIWDIKSGKENTLLNKADMGLATSVTFSPDGKKLAAAFSHGILLWDIESGQESTVFKEIGNSALSVTFSLDGKKLAVGFQDKAVRLWDIENDQESFILLGHEKEVRSVSFSPDGKKLASASFDKTIRLWDIESIEWLSYIQLPGAGYGVSFSLDGEKMAVAQQDGQIGLYGVKSDKDTFIKGHIQEQEIASSVSFSPDGRQLASASFDKTVRLWDIESGKEITTFRGHEKEVNSVSFGPDDKKLASASKDKTVRLWDIESGKEITTFRGHEKEVNSVSFGPDGKKLASASKDKTVRLWDIESGKEVTFRGHKGEVLSVAFSPDGKRLASASQDKTVRLWDIESDKEVAIFEGHEDGVMSVTFSPDGKKLASASKDETVWLWDIESGKKINTFKGHDNVVNSVTFSPDGKKLASVSDDSTLILWDTLNYSTLFLNNSKQTPLYHLVVEAAEFLWELKIDDLKIVSKKRTPEDMERFGALLALPAPGQSKFDQVLEWAQQQQKETNKSKQNGPH